MLRPDELATRRGVLQLCNPLAAGLVSFAIWAYVAGLGSAQYIRINDNKFLNRDHSLMLVFGSFLWLGMCSVVSALATIGKERSKRKWQLLQGILVAASLALLFMPFYLFEKREDLEGKLKRPLEQRTFRVAIPYKDPSLDIHLGTTSTPLVQCKVFLGIEAVSEKDATSKALEQFAKLTESIQRYGSRNAGKEVVGSDGRLGVEVERTQVVVSEEIP